MRIASDYSFAEQTIRMGGILKLAYKLLVNDKAKFITLLVGISFAYACPENHAEYNTGVCGSAIDGLGKDEGCGFHRGIPDSPTWA